MLINGCVGKCLLMEIRYGLRHGFKKSNLILSVWNGLFVTVRIVSGLILGWRCWMIGEEGRIFLALAEHTHGQNTGQVYFQQMKLIEGYSL